MPLAATPSDQLVQIGLFLLALVVILIVLRFILHLAGRILTLGCLLIVALGVALFVMRFLNR